MSSQTFPSKLCLDIVCGNILFGIPKITRLRAEILFLHWAASLVLKLVQPVAGAGIGQFLDFFPSNLNFVKIWRMPTAIIVLDCYSRTIGREKLTCICIAVLMIDISFYGQGKTSWYKILSPMYVAKNREEKVKIGFSEKIREHPVLETPANLSKLRFAPDSHISLHWLTVRRKIWVKKSSFPQIDLESY